MLMGRKPIASDANDVAYCITRAKTMAPALPCLRRRLSILETQFEREKWSRKAASLPELFHYCFHRRTLTGREKGRKRGRKRGRSSGKEKRTQLVTDFCNPAFGELYHFNDAATDTAYDPLR